MVEFSLNEADDSHKGAETNGIDCKEVCDIREVVGLVLGVVELAVVESGLD